MRRGGGENVLGGKRLGEVVARVMGGNQENEHSREVVVRYCWRVKFWPGFQQMRTKERLLNFDTWKLQKVY